MNGALSRTRPALPACTAKAPRCTIQNNHTPHAPLRASQDAETWCAFAYGRWKKDDPPIGQGLQKLPWCILRMNSHTAPRVQFFFSFTRRYQCPATTLKARTSTPTTTTPSAKIRAAGRPSKATIHPATASRGRTTLRDQAAIREAVSNMAILPAAHPRTSADPSSGALP